MQTPAARHYPKQSFTMVADTPENLRLKQQSELQSQVRYKEEFEKNKGKGFSVVADTPELQRIKKTQDQISNAQGGHQCLALARLGVQSGQWINAPYGTCGWGQASVSCLAEPQSSSLWGPGLVGRLLRGLWAMRGHRCCRCYVHLDQLALRRVAF
ncbi:hypothetical protein Celaphus_00001213 [Cervus elaphus hippelaphus]|uniref:Uncharacterized protein n=1 Tax=Cervus elaphus hippelaphus TaxID=46360 RepID=A0A212D8L4_CEREH|nr:hypothetical protein Celaphus_00001213 [Cervus elaphus hippelaphus]